MIYIFFALFVHKRASYLGRIANARASRKLQWIIYECFLPLKYFAIVVIHTILICHLPIPKLLGARRLLTMSMIFSMEIDVGLWCHLPYIKINVRWPISSIKILKKKIIQNKYWVFLRRKNEKNAIKITAHERKLCLNVCCYAFSSHTVFHFYY